jgi:hypothetical protein
MTTNPFTETTPFTKSQLEDALLQYVHEDSTIRNDYSGRAMFGDRCFGIVHDANDGLIALAIVEACRQSVFDQNREADWFDGDYAMERAEELIRTMRGDNMGRSSITYFPGWLLDGADEDDDDEDED